jgi:hypothetical protein
LFKQFEDIALFNRANLINQAKKLLACIKEVPGSDRGQNIDYSVSCFPSVYQNRRTVERLIDDKCKIL